MKRIVLLVVPFVLAGFWGASASHAAKNSASKKDEDSVRLSRSRSSDDNVGDDRGRGRGRDDRGGADHGKGRGRGKGRGVQEVRREIRLSGDDIDGIVPKGEAEFRVNRKGGTKFKAEAEHVNLPAGTVLTVKVNDVVVGTLTLNRLREGELELNTNDGDTVPAVTAGTTVVITTSDGSTVVSGQF